MEKLERTDKNAHPTGYQVSRLNAVRHGLLSQHTVLPWEDETEYQALLDALIAEHKPLGPTEEHLVEELAGIMWRKRRLRFAEGVVMRNRVNGTTDSMSRRIKGAVADITDLEISKWVEEGMRSTPEQTAHALEELKEAKRVTAQAIEILKSEEKNAYPKGGKLLNEITRGVWFSSSLKSKMPPDSVSLLKYLEEEVLPLLAKRQTEIGAWSIIKLETVGKAFAPEWLESLARYEVHFDRKLERTLAMLIKLKDLRSDNQS